MLNELRRVFRESLAAFQAEVGRREPEDEVAEMLAAMRRELVDTRAALPAYHEEVARAEAAARKERELQHQCERRLAAAERIGDQETAKIAAEYLGKHRDRAEVLERKVAASRAELELLTREAGEMMSRFKEAEANRFALVAELRTARTRGRMEALLDGEAPPPGPSPAEIDERLRELKRTMGRD